MNQLRGRKNTVLICDDDEGIVDITKMILQEKGYQVETVLNSFDIYSKIKQHKPDLILLDLWMPNLRGEEIIESLKKDKDTNKIPVIVLSAYRHTASVSRKCGADDFITKPFDINDLEKIVKKYLK